MYYIYTDGAYSSTRDQGGIGVVILKDDEKILEYSKCYKQTTNNQMEIMAVIAGLQCIKNPVEEITIISDSMYVIGCATLGWKRKKNVSLWKLFDKVINKTSKLCSNISFKHVEGHANNELNNLCDRLAVSASHEI